MALQKAALAVTFGGGVDTKTDAKQVAPTKLLDLQNCVFSRTQSLIKRNGYRALGQAVDGSDYTYVSPIGILAPAQSGLSAPPPSLDPGNPGNPNAGGLVSTANPDGFAKRGNELVLFATGQSYSYRPSTDSWDQIGPVSSVVQIGTPVARTGTDQTMPDQADNAGVTVVAWEDNRGGVWCSVLETDGHRILLPATQLDSGAARSPRCVAAGDVLNVIWANGGRLWVVVVNPASPEATPTPMILTEDLDPANQSYDVLAAVDQAYPAIRPALLAWALIGGGYRLGYAHPAGVLGSPVTGLPSVATYTDAVTGPIAVGLWLSPKAGGPLAVVAWASSDLNYRFHDATNPSDGSGATGVLVTGPETWDRVTIEFADTEPLTGSAKCWWAGEIHGATADVARIVSGSIDGAGGLSQQTNLLGHALASHAFYDNGDVYAAVVHSVLFFPYVAILRLSGGLVAQSRALPGESSGILARPVVPSAIALGLGPTGGTSRRHAIALGYRIQLEGSSGKQFGEVGIQRMEFDFDHDDNFRSAELGRGLYLGGSLIQHYDGDRWAEADFHCAPDTASGAIAWTTLELGNLTPNSTYVYKIVYEEIDGQGELHPGPVGVGVSVVLVGGGVASVLTIPTYRLTSKRRVRIGVFRSLSNANAEWFRVSSVDPTAVGANGYVLNDPTVDSVSFTDELSDATIAVLEPLYTNGGVLSNDPCPQGGEIIAGGKSRLFWTDPLDGSLVRYSQQLRDDTAAECSASLTQRIDPFGGDIVAIAVMDDNVVVFKETAIFAFGGSGPDADGGVANPANAWSAPQLVTSDVGCKSRSSVCQMPLGIVFQTDKGIYLLDRGLQARRIGDPVYAYNAQRIVRSTLLPDRPHVVFLTDAGRTLLFDYDRDQWSTFTNHTGLDSIVVEGAYHYLRNDGQVFVETIGAYVDGVSSHIPRLIDTAWIKASGYLQGWQRIWHAMILGQWKSKHTLRFRYRLDYEDAWSAPIDIDVDSVYTPNNYGDGNYGAGPYGGIVGLSSLVYQERVHVNRRCQAISFRIEDVEAAGDYGACFELSELLLTGGVLGPMFHPGAARSG